MAKKGRKFDVGDYVTDKPDAYSRDYYMADVKLAVIKENIPRYVKVEVIEWKEGRPHVSRYDIERHGSREAVIERAKRTVENRNIYKASIDHADVEGDIDLFY